MKKFIVVFFILLCTLICVSFIACAGSPSVEMADDTRANRKIDVWDFGGIQAAGAQFNNNITKEKLDAIPTLNIGGKFTLADVEFGDLVLSPIANDRAYYYEDFGMKPGKKSYGNQGYDSVTFPDGYQSHGIYYCNGTGGEERRYIIVNNVKAGDKISFYAITSNSNETKVHFAHINDEKIKTGLQDEVASMMQSEKKYEYVAKADGSYKIYTEKEGGKPCYYRVVRTPAVFVTGSLKIPSSLKGQPYGISFVNQNTGVSTEGKVSGTSFGVYLAPGYDYVAVLTGCAGFGISDDSKLVKVTDEALIKGSQTAKLKAEAQSILTVKGTITGFDPAYDVSKLSIVLYPPKDTLYQSSTMKISGSEFSGLLEPNVKYTAELKGVNDYFITKGKEFSAGSDFSQDIKVGLRTVSKASGKIIGAKNGDIKTISFVNVNDGYKYSGTVANGNYATELREGVYDIELDGGYKCFMHLVMEGSTVNKDILVHPEKENAPQIALKKSLYVGYKNRKDSFATLGEAVKQASYMNPQSENDRITIYIAPGVYREQVIIRTPYITLKNETPSQEVKLTWYYGIGYKYYSCGKNGYYSEDAKLDRYEKGSPARWGVATQVTPGAKYFKADGITFESSFNKYITDEELTDGVVSDGSIQYQRKLSSDVRSAKAKERSSALCLEADYSECYNCKFIGNQDTLFTGSDVHQYYRNCYIEGTTDYVFGEGDCVFENCELSWCGNPDLPAEGHIAVAKSKGQKGYLFLNCTVTTLDGMKMGKADFGRPWEQGAKVAFINTKLDRKDSIADDGWGQMSGNVPEKATYREFNTTIDGKKANVAFRIMGTMLNSAAGYSVKDYLSDWTPSFYKAAPSAKPSFVKKPALTSSEDLNLPYTGDILTVRYELDKESANYDTSLIRWIRVKDGKETVVKLSAGNASKTYLLQDTDVGGIIRVEVIAENGGANKGETAVARLDAKVLQGSAAQVTGVPEKGERVKGKINIFLAGDSTVKDYSDIGMYMNGKNADEGSWGEYLGFFFDSKKCVVKNYANGGRSTRNFINEGTLEKIASQIGKGDYLFIQFGHNDSSNTSGYLEDRHVPLGAPDANGKFPVNAGKKTATPASYQDRYGPEFYAWDSGGTYKWFLKQYIEVAKKAGATPVLVTPVSRLNFSGDKIKPHHDSVDKNSPSQPCSENNAYVRAVRQLAQEENVALLDAFDITAGLYETARASAKKLPPQLFGGDVTHNNKLGGFIAAALIAKDLQSRGWNISKMTAKPVKIIGSNSKGKTLFTVGVSSTFNAYEPGMDMNYLRKSEFWSEFGQNLINSIGK